MAMARKLPEFTAVQKWLDIKAEIKLKKAFEQMMTDLEIPALVIRSVDLKAISALNDLGLKLSLDAEIDLVLVYVSGDFLHVIVCEVKRADIYPWQTECGGRNKQAVNKAENQLTKDVNALMDILAGILPNQIYIHTLAFFPDASSMELETIFCSSCLKTGIISQEDLADLSLLQNKTQVPDKPDPATTSGEKKLPTLTAGLLSHQSLLHVGYREIKDKEKLITDRHRHNLQTVDGKILKKEFIVASPQQQQVISSFTASSTKRHLVLEGPAGTGKTLVALQVANNLVESSKGEGEVDEPVLVVTAYRQTGEEFIMKYLDSSAGARAIKYFKGWDDIREEFGVPEWGHKQLLLMAKAFAERWKRKEIVMLVDEILDKHVLIKLEEQIFPDSVRMILVVNPVSESSLTLPPSFLHVTLTTPYRSTIAITRLARFIALFLLRIGLIFSFQALEVPEPRVRKRPF